jgi:LPS-assembly protein
MFDFFNDRETDDGTGSGFEGFTGDDEDRKNKDRWWLRAKADQDLPAGFRMKLDLDVVSDQDYLREFKRGYSSFDTSDDYFMEEFGRDLDVHTETIRQSNVIFNRNWTQYSLNADFVWLDNVVIRKNDDPDPTLQRLPRVQFGGSKQQVCSSPYYFNMESSYSYFWRDFGSRGHRADLHPRFYYPMNLLKFLEFEPSAGLRETLWYVPHSQGPEEESDDKTYSREVFDCRADLSTDVTRIFRFDWKEHDRLKHTIRPQVVYEYMSAPSQDRLPLFEGIDRLEEFNKVTYSITNFFSVRSAKKRKPAPTEAGELCEALPRPSYGYNDFCRIKLSQSYDIKERRRNDRVGRENSFSDIKGEIELRPHPCLDLDADATWDPYDSEFSGYTGLLNVCDTRGDSASIDYRYTRDENRSLSTEAVVKVFGPLSLLGEYQRNLKDDKTIEWSSGFRLEPQCWSLEFRYTEDNEVDDREFFVEIGLHGLGKIGL